MNRRTLLIGASALGIAAFAGGTLCAEPAPHRRSRRPPPPRRRAADNCALLIRPHSPVLGPADAPVTLVEFFDPSCEACRAFHPVVQEIHQPVPDAGAGRAALHRVPPGIGRGGAHP